MYIVENDDVGVDSLFALVYHVTEDDARISGRDYVELAIGGQIMVDCVPLIVAWRLIKSWGPTFCVGGRSTTLRSPSVANSTVRFWRVSVVWFTRSTSKTISN